MLKGAVICVLDCKLIKLGTGQGSHTVVLVILPFPVSLTIAKFLGLSEQWFVAAFFSACTHTTFEYLVHLLFHMEKLCEHFMEIQQKWLHMLKQLVPRWFCSPRSWEQDYCKP